MKPPAEPSGHWCPWHPNRLSDPVMQHHHEAARREVQRIRARYGDNMPLRDLWAFLTDRWLA